MPLSDELIESARQRLSIHPGISEADLRRAISDLYYSLFHCVCETLVKPIGHDPDSEVFKDLFNTLYRLPDHSHIEKRCKEIDEQAFSRPIKDFAKQLISFKNKRHKADYHPLEIFKRSAVENDIVLIEGTISEFRSAPLVEQTRFAYYLAIRGRRND